LKDKKLNNKALKASKSGSEGHWVTINDKPVLIKK